MQSILKCGELALPHVSLQWGVVGAGHHHSSQDHICGPTFSVLHLSLLWWTQQEKVLGVRYSVIFWRNEQQESL